MVSSTAFSAGESARVLSRGMTGMETVVTDIGISVCCESCLLVHFFEARARVKMMSVLADTTGR